MGLNDRVVAEGVLFRPGRLNIKQLSLSTYWFLEQENESASAKVPRGVTSRISMRSRKGRPVQRMDEDQLKGR